MQRFSYWIAVVGFVALVGMIAVTLIDIALRLSSRALPVYIGAALPAAVPGVVDLVEFTLVIVAHLSIAVTFLIGAHVTVDVVAAQLPDAVRRLARRVSMLACLLFMAACALQAFSQGRRQFASGVVSATLNLPVWWYWVPVVAGCLLSAFACAAHLLRSRPAGGKHS